MMRAALGASGLVLALGAAAIPSSPASATQRHRGFGLGLVPTPADVIAARTPRALALASATSLPASVDLTKFAPPAGNQGSIGSCASWATTYTAMGYWLRRDGRPGFPLAPMYAYSQLTGGHDVGTSIGGNLGLAMGQGIDTLSDYPQGNYDYKDLPTPSEKQNAKQWTLSSFTGVTHSKAGIEAALAAGTPVVLGIKVYANFMSLGASTWNYTKVRGSFVGRHAITALGYDATGVTVENSWGAGWGKSGFAHLSWAFVTGGNTFEAWAVHDLASAAPQMSITSVQPSVGSTAGGQTVTIAGTNFPPGSAVQFGGVAATNVVENAAGTQLTVTTPPHVVGPPSGQGWVSVSIIPPNGGTPFNYAVAYRYAAPPTIGSVTPRSGPAGGGTKLTIKGTNLWGAQVSFGGVVVDASGAVNVNGTVLTAIAPPHAPGTADLTLSTAGGSVGGGAYQWT
jgi:hypothetical protein